MVAIMSVGFVSCGDDDDEPTIIGTWLLSGDELIYVFNDNGKGEGMEYMYRDGEMVIKDRWSFTYTYDVKNDILVYTEDDGDTDIWDVISLTENTLVLRENGGTRTLTFIKGKLPESDFSPAIDNVSIVGIWEYTDGDQYARIIFNENGTGHELSLWKGNVDFESDFTYEYNSKTMVVTIYEDGEKGSVQLKALTQTTLIIELNDTDKQGNKIFRTYTRK